MILKVDTPVIVLVRDSHSFSKDETLLPSGSVIFNKHKYKIYYFRVHSNIKLNDVCDGMEQNEFFHGFGVGNYGITMLYESPDSRKQYTQLITWRDVLQGGANGLQVWEKQNYFRNLAKLFHNRKSTDDGIMRLMTLCYHKLYGDRVQCGYLLVCYY